MHTTSEVVLPTKERRRDGVETIRSLRPSLSREEALLQLRRPGLTGLIRSLRDGSLLSVADFYIPFRLYRLKIRNGARTEEKLFGLDSVQGNFDLFSFDSVPQSQDLIDIETRNHPRPCLEEERANQLVIEKVRRIIFGSGFFRIRDLTLHAEPVPLDLHIPYWLGFCGSKDNLRLVVMDAVRCQIEGAKVRNFIHEWLLASTPPIEGSS